MYLYLDESGCLGFDFINKKPSKFFVITLLVIKESKTIKIFNKAVARTLSNKLNNKSKKTRIIHELKGSGTTLEIKKYFLDSISKHTSDWELFSIVLNKLSLLNHITNPDKNRVYNHMTHQLLETIDFPTKGNVNLIVDRSKNDLGVKEFNNYLYANLSLSLNLEAKLYISHDNSDKHKGIQAADMFCYGIARKHELGDLTWYNLFKDRIILECNFQV